MLHAELPGTQPNALRRMPGKIISFCGGVRVPEGRPCPSASAGYADAMEMIFECMIRYPFLPIFTRFLLAIKYPFILEYSCRFLENN